MSADDQMTDFLMSSLLESAQRTMEGIDCEAVMAPGAMSRPEIEEATALVVRALTDVLRALVHVRESSGTLTRESRTALLASIREFERTPVTDEVAAARAFDVLVGSFARAGVVPFGGGGAYG